MKNYEGIAILGLAGLTIYFLTKSGIFGLANKASEQIGKGIDYMTSGEIGTNVGEAVFGTGVTQEEIFQAAKSGQTESPAEPAQSGAMGFFSKLLGIKPATKVSPMVMKQIQQVSALYPLETTADNWGSVAVKHGIVFDSQGNIISKGNFRLTPEEQAYAQSIEEQYGVYDPNSGVF